MVCSALLKLETIVKLLFFFVKWPMEYQSNFHDKLGRKTQRFKGKYVKLAKNFAKRSQKKVSGLSGLRVLIREGIVTIANQRK